MYFLYSTAMLIDVFSTNTLVFSTATILYLYTHYSLAFRTKTYYFSICVIMFMLPQLFPRGLGSLFFAFNSAQNTNTKKKSIHGGGHRCGQKGAEILYNGASKRHIPSPSPPRTNILKKNIIICFAIFLILYLSIQNGNALFLISGLWGLYSRTMDLCFNMFGCFKNF